MRMLRVLQFMVGVAVLTVGTAVGFAQATSDPKVQGADQLLEHYRSLGFKWAESNKPANSDLKVGDMTKPLVRSSSGALTVRCMPSSLDPTTGGVQPYAWRGRNFTIWGNASGGLPPYTYSWDFGDGTAPATGDATTPNYIAVPHSYAALGQKTATLTVTDAALAIASRGVKIDVVADPPDDEVRRNAAIQDGLRYLYLAQNSSNGSWGGYLAASTGTAVASFELAGHVPSNDPDSDIYADPVQKGLDFLFTRLDSLALSPQPACGGFNPDTDGNGIGLYVIDYPNGYMQGMVMLAIAASADPTRLATTGAVAGRSYRGILADMVDQLAYAQTDPGSYEGGWRYTVSSSSYGSSDNSIVQWASIGMAAAESPPWNIHPPACVKTELDTWLDYSQLLDGGFGYAGPDGSGHARTGSGIYSHFFIGTPLADPRVQNALGWLCSNWCADMFAGNLYAMYAVKKALFDYEQRTGQVLTVCGHEWDHEFV